VENARPKQRKKTKEAENCPHRVQASPFCEQGFECLSIELSRIVRQQSIARHNEDERKGYDGSYEGAAQQPEPVLLEQRERDAAQKADDRQGSLLRCGTFVTGAKFLQRRASA
jgi:hypothetical protein